MLPLKHLLTGLNKVKLELLRLHPDEDFTIKRTFILLLLAVKLISRRKSVTLESLPRNKWTTLNDKKVFSTPDTLAMSWLQTSLLELIGNEKVLTPFWNEQCLEKSKKLWLPTVTDSVGLPLTTLNTYLESSASNSLFSTTRIQNPRNKSLQKTSCQSSTSLVADKWESEGTLLRARKVRFYPTLKQTKKLKQWFGTSRYVYNNALNGIRNGESIDMPKLRDKYVTRTFNTDFGLYELFENQKFSYVPKDWELETPKDIRAGAIRDLCKAYKTCFSNRQNGNIRKFKVSFRSKKKSSSIEIPKSSLKQNNKKYLSVYKNRFRLCNDKCLKKLNITNDCRILHHRNKWFIVIPVPVPKSKSTANEACGVDPGVRKFVTVFGDDGVTLVSLRKELLRRYHDKLERLQSLRDRGQISKRTWARGSARVYDRLDYLIDETHNKVIKLLLDNYSTVYIPKFESQKLAGKMKNRRTKRNLFQLKHYKFRTKLESKAELYGSNVSVCTEEFTTKTCTGCGELNDVGFSEVYDCTQEV